MTTRSAALLRSVVEHGDATTTQLAETLVVSLSDLESYALDKRVMSLARQLCLALFVIHRLPKLARRGHSLRGQVIAAMAFESKVTATHAEAPSHWRNVRGSNAR